MSTETQDGMAVLEAGLRALHATRSVELRQRFDRSLPFGEMVVDRWARARALGFGDGASIYDSAVVIGTVQVGELTWIGPQVLLDGSGGLAIGATCSISAGVQVYTHDSVAWALSGGNAAYERAPVSIGDHCYIGPMSVITKGVTIGRHCLVGANSVVKQSLPDHSIAVGSPARIVGRVVLDAASGVTLQYDRDGTR
ncbi:MAG: acyltransferase [Gemmatimonadaceae bacterium]|nr:acyltransferase [Gemmatimonadaceae bacterium]